MEEVLEIVVGKLAGFCNGVKNAVNVAEKQIEKGKVYCLGEIVHNKQVIEYLELKGMITVSNIEEVPDGECVIFRAHGEGREVYDKAKQKNIKVIDATCGKVRLIHNKVDKEKNNSFIIIIGKRTHPETIGTKGFSGKNSFIIETEDDILDAYKEYEKTNLGQVYVVCQTTISTKLFERIKEEIENNFVEADVIIDNTICDATELRQKEVSQMSKACNKMIIIGGKNSSNTKELVNIAKVNCKIVYGIETVEEIKTENFDKDDKIGIMAGASTPEKSIKEVKEYLEDLDKNIQ